MKVPTRKQLGNAQAAWVTACGSSQFPSAGKAQAWLCASACLGPSARTTARRRARTFRRAGYEADVRRIDRANAAKSASPRVRTLVRQEASNAVVVDREIAALTEHRIKRCRSPRSMPRRTIVRAVDEFLRTSRRPVGFRVLVRDGPWEPKGVVPTCSMRCNSRVAGGELKDRGYTPKMDPFFFALPRWHYRDARPWWLENRTARLRDVCDQS